MIEEDCNNIFLITGSSGFVAEELIPILKRAGETFGVDLVPSRFTDLQCDIGGDDIRQHLRRFGSRSVTVIHLAAARLDFGFKPSEYMERNVVATEKFLDSLHQVNVARIIHVSSVAAFAGASLTFSSSLSLDDAYRVSKDIQERVVTKWAEINSIDYVVLYPSAIFQSSDRVDTNIGKMRLIASYAPVLPNIPVEKSLTFLPHFAAFISDLAVGRLFPGRYLTIESPTLSVTDQLLAIRDGKRTLVLNIPYLRSLMLAMARFLSLFSAFGRFDVFLTTGRVTKLWRDTSMKESARHIDRSTYSKVCSVTIEDALRA